MFKIKIFFLFLFFINFLAFSQNWQELKGEHFIIYFISDEKFAERTLEKAELYYKTIAEDLGYPRYKEFWLWEKRVKIYLFPTKEDYLNKIGQPTWSAGMADYNKKTIYSFNQSQDFLISVLPHEIAHLIFRDFIGFKSNIPLWLDEGVAQWAEVNKRSFIKNEIKKLFQNDLLLSLREMMKLDISSLTEADKIHIRRTTTKDEKEGILFINEYSLIALYYLQSASLVSFLIERYGGIRFTDFCRQLRDGKDLENALRSAYTEFFNNLDDLERKWKKYIVGGE